MMSVKVPPRSIQKSQVPVVDVMRGLSLRRSVIVAGHKIGGGPAPFPPSPLLWHQPACKPGSVRRAASHTRDGHSSGTPVAWRLEQPTRTAGSGHRSRSPFRLAPARASAPSLFGLAPGGVCHAVCVAADAVRSYRTLSPLPLPLPTLPASRRVEWARRSALCGTFPGLAPAGRYPAPYVHGARTFLPGHLSVLAGAAVQPTDPAVNGHPGAPRQGLRQRLVNDRPDGMSGACRRLVGGGAFLRRSATVAEVGQYCFASAR
jgi:hypothetical protein